MDICPNQRWDVGEAVAGFFKNIVEWTSKPFEHCGLGPRMGGTADEEEEDLGQLNHSRRVVTFSHEVEVACEWRNYLARTGHEAEHEGRDRAMTMVDGDEEDEFRALVEAAANDKKARTTIVQAPRMYSRAARFALEGKIDESGGRSNRSTSRRNGQAGTGRVGHTGPGGGRVLFYGRMKDIVMAGRGGRGGGFKGRRMTGFERGLDAFIDDDEDCNREEEEEEEEEDGATSLLDSYDGSLESLKRLVFPPTKSSRPVRKIFDDAVLASCSPAQWMTAADLKVILNGTKGWRKGSIGNGGNSRRQWRRHRGSSSHDKVDVGAAAAAAAAAQEKICKLWAHNTVLKEELFGLALAEHRTSVLFKRAFLNWEGSSSYL